MSSKGIYGIAKHLVNLLYTSDRLIIPGLGCLIAEMQDSQIHPVTFEMQPPRKVLRFDANIQDDDGILVSYLAKSLHTKKETVKKNIKEWVDSFREDLATGPQTIEGIGTFQIKLGKEIHFVPDESYNFLGESFGLKPIVAKPILRNIPPSANTTATQKPVKEEPKKQPETAEEQEIEVAEPSKPRSKHRYAIAIFLIPILAIAGISYAFLDQFSQIYWMVKDTAQIENPALHITPSPTPIIEEIAPTIEDTVTTTEEPTVDEPETLRYFIVAGCFKSEHNANNLVTDLQGKGYTASIQGTTPQGLLRVCYNGYADSLDADAALKKVLATQNPSAWLLDIQEDRK